jgi:septal ring factor EnvC (AmiA/AmiB activator)
MKMWNGELNPQLRRIPEIRKIDEYLRGMTFERRLFGCDLDDVQDCLTEVGRRYKAVIASLLPQQGQAWQQQELRGKLAQLEQENMALNNGFQEWTQWYEQANKTLQAENERLRREAAAYQTEVTQLRRESAAFYAQLTQRGRYN